MTRPIYEPSLRRTDAEFGYARDQLFRRPGQKGRNAVIQIKVFADDKIVSVGDGRFIFAISKDMDVYNLVLAEAYVTTVGSSGTALIQLRNISQTTDMLSTRINIDPNEFHSKDASTQPVINLLADDVAWADRIAIDVDAIGSGSKGLGVNLTFAPGVLVAPGS